MPKLSRERLIELVLLFIWIVVQVLLFQKHGWKIVNDSHRYITYGSNLLEHGLYIDVHNKWYFSYVLFLSLCFKLGLGVKGAIIIQTLVSGISFWALSRAVQTFFEDSKYVGITLLALLIGWVKLSEWNFYVMTESLYISFICLTIASILYVLKKRLSWIWLLPLGLITFFLRPSSLAFFTTLLLVVLIRKLRASKLPFWYRAALLVFALIGVSLMANYMLKTFDMISVYNRGELVFAYGLYPSYPHQSLMVITPPSDLYIPKDGYPKLIELGLYIFGNFGFFLKISAGKLFYYLGNVKPYFTWKHNTFIVLLLWPIYFFSIRNIKKVKDPISLFTLLFVVFNCAIVILSTEDWDGRFLLPVLPVVFIPAAREFSAFITKKARTQKSA